MAKQSKARSGMDARRASTAGKRTAKPDRAIRGKGGKGVAQVTSKTRAANEAPQGLRRGNTDFARTAAKTIKGHRGATDRKMQAKRDIRNAPND